eukprot:FR737435.1.p1 GENE.FR737435.1~~FR737435.1.p1  ORF type:complete len:157 (+),score=9.89 FR737435.1:48-518(+)
MAESTADGDLPDSFGFSFESAAKLFCETELKCSYESYLNKKGISVDTNTKIFVTTWSKPTPTSPAPPAVGYIKLEVFRDPELLDGDPHRYVVSRYQVEFNQFFYANDTPFEERWLDIVISRKLRFRNLVDLGDDFLNTRLGHEEKDAVESKDSAPS